MRAQKVTFILTMALVVSIQSQSFAAPMLCESFFDMRQPSAQETKEALKAVEFLNAKQMKLAKMSVDLVNGQYSELAKQQVSEISFFIEHGMVSKVLGSVQGKVLDIELKYAALKMREPRVLELREAQSLTSKEKTELKSLERERESVIKFIGKHFVEHRWTIQAIEKYVQSTDPILADNAQYIQKNLGINEEYKSAYPALRSVRRPTVDEIADIYNGVDPRLSFSEKSLARTAMLDKSIQVQHISNLFRRISSIAGDNAFEAIYKTAVGQLFSKIKGFGSLLRSNPNASKDTTILANETAILKEIKGIVDDNYAIGSHYPGIRKILETELNTQQKFELMMQLSAQFDSVNGIPVFMTTLARRSDAFPVWTSLKEYVEKTYPKEVMTQSLTLLQVMQKAETSRENGLLPSVFDPQRAITFKAARTSLIVALSAIAAWYFYNSHDKDKEPKIQEPAKDGAQSDQTSFNQVIDKLSTMSDAELKATFKI